LDSLALLEPMRPQARQGPQVLRANREEVAPQAPWGQPGPREPLGARETRGASVIQARRASRGLLAPRALRGWLDQRVKLGPVGWLGLQVHLELQGLLGLLAPLGLLEAQGRRALQDFRAWVVNRVSREQQEQQGFRVRSDRLDQPGRTDKMVLLVLSGHRATWGLQASPGQRGLPVPTVP
jgi:hypothetical protein